MKKARFHHHENKIRFRFWNKAWMAAPRWFVADLSWWGVCLCRSRNSFTESSSTTYNNGENVRRSVRPTGGGGGSVERVSYLWVNGANARDGSSHHRWLVWTFGIAAAAEPNKTCWWHFSLNTSQPNHPSMHAWETMMTMDGLAHWGSHPILHIYISVCWGGLLLFIQLGETVNDNGAFFPTVGGPGSSTALLLWWFYFIHYAEGNSSSSSIKNVSSTPGHLNCL